MINARPFGLNFQSKFARDCRPPGVGEARVSIFTKAGDLCCKKIGRIEQDGGVSVIWLGLSVRATKARYGYEYRIPTTPGEATDEDAEREDVPGDDQRGAHGVLRPGDC